MCALKNKKTGIFAPGFLLTLIFGTILISCEHRASEEDWRRIAAIRDQYGETLDISLEREIYVIAKDKSPHKEGINEDVAIMIYKLFFFSDSNKKIRRSTNYVYLNIYNADDEFPYQIYYNRKSDSFEKSFAEHY